MHPACPTFQQAITSALLQRIGEWRTAARLCSARPLSRAPGGTGRRPFPTHLCAVVALIAYGIPAFAQKPGPADHLTFPVEIRLRGEGRDDVGFDKSGGDPRELLARLRIGLKLQSKEGWTAFVQSQYAFDQVFDPKAMRFTTNDVDIHQGFVEAGQGNARWRLGRQELVYGDQRLIGNLDWINVARSFDAAKVTIADKRVSTDLFLAKLGLQAGKVNDPTLGAIYSTIKGGTGRTADLYAIYKTVRLSSTTNESRWTFGTRPKVVRGPFDAQLEAAWQAGESAGKPIEAWAYAALAGYTLPGRAGLRIGIERDAASGGPATARASRTFDQLYPTNHLHYGLADFVGWKNMEDWRLSLRARPARGWTLGIDGHKFALADGRDFWYNASGKPVTGLNGQPLRDTTGAAGRDLGTELDLSVAYVVSKNLTLSGAFGRFSPGSFVRATNAGKASPTNWFYLQSSWQM